MVGLWGSDFHSWLWLRERGQTASHAYRRNNIRPKSCTAEEDQRRKYFTNKTPLFQRVTRAGVNPSLWHAATLYMERNQGVQHLGAPLDQTIWRKAIPAQHLLTL